MPHQSAANLIEMPLIIGSEELNAQKKDSFTVNPSQFQISLNLRNDIELKKFLKNNHQDEMLLCNYMLKSEKQIEIFRKDNQDLLDLSNSKSGQNHLFPVHKDSTSKLHKISQFNFSFKVSFSSLEHNDRFHVMMTQQDISFQLVKISSHVKFVRNSLLLEILNTDSSENKGLLTLDQSRRILFQPMNMLFPVIGFWFKTQTSISNIQLYHHLSLFIRQRHEKKCLFKLDSNKKKYFYFVRISQKERRMDTFVVSWTLEEQMKKQFIVSNSVEKINIKWNSQNHDDKNQESTRIKEGTSKEALSSGQNSLRSDSHRSQENGMDFTLRELKKNEFSTLESLINYSYLSPIKQLEDNQRQDNLFSQEYGNSPQFSTLTKQDNSQNQCQQLRVQVKDQQRQIQNLKEIILRMESELKIYKHSRMSTNCQTNTKHSKFSSQISSPYANQFSTSHLNSNVSSPQETRRLRESDLKSNSISRSDWLKNSSNKKSQQSRGQNINYSKVNDQFNNGRILLQKECIPNTLYCQLPRIIEEDGRDPWDYMEIIEE